MFCSARSIFLREKASMDSCSLIASGVEGNLVKGAATTILLPSEYLELPSLKLVSEYRF